MGPTGERVKDTGAMIAGMAPKLDPETYHFCTVSAPHAAEAAPLALASFAEEEGLSLILPQEAAGRLGLQSDLPMRRITLSPMPVPGASPCSARGDASRRNGSHTRSA